MKSRDDRDAVTWQPYSVGQYYNVPCVNVDDWYGFKGWLPVLGTKHSDLDVIGFAPEHMHLDWRFVPHSLFRRLEWRNVNGLAICCPDRYGDTVIVDGPQPKRRLCKRDMPPWPDPIPWLQRLEDAYASQRLRHGICPHRGTPLTNCPVIDGVVTCPTHGLRWDIATGALVRTERAK